MLKLIGVNKSFIWGGEKLKKMFNRRSEDKIAECWEVSVHPDGECKCEGGTLRQYLSDHPSAVGNWGGDMPVLIKYIDAGGDLSVQVHPDDAYAKIHENDSGKTELWYVIQADEGAGLYCGFKRDTDKEEFLKKLSQNKVEELLNFVPVKAGDSFLIEAGTVHAIRAGCVICEIQQSSNVTYRIYDYGRVGKDGKPRPLHVDKAMDVINFKAYKNNAGLSGEETVAGGTLKTLADCGYFRTRLLKLDGVYEQKNASSFTAVNAVEGSGLINGAPFSAGDSFFISAGELMSACGTATLLLTDRP